ncbi:hypothetical protein B484DRAFT_469624, partial [Ochromonadaceae sp. CCMP2298]
VDVWFCSEKKIRELNKEWRDISKSTDVLSFPSNDFSSPGVMIDDGTLQFEKMLGDLVVAPEYVLRACQRDQADYNAGTILCHELQGDAGCSKRLATEFDLSKRVPIYLVHGMLHLLGYDHETDEEWAQMTQREKEVLGMYEKMYEKTQGGV